MNVKTLFLNVILARAGFPSELLTSRTVVIRKKGTSVTLADFRAISMASVVIRLSHKTAMSGISQHWPYYSTIYILFSQAFDSVHHKAVVFVLGEASPPLCCTRYCITKVYSNNLTVLEVHGSCSETTKVNRGMRQGDAQSLSSFCLVINGVLRFLPHGVR